MVPLLALALAVPGLAAGPDFDGGAGSLVAVLAPAGDLRDSLASADAAPPAAPAALPDRTDVDCVRFAFAPADRESEPVWLRSQEWRQECRELPGRGRQCWERPGLIWRERVRVSIPERKPPFPWERESFQACLRGPSLTFHVRQGAYEYAVRARRDERGVEVRLAPGAKRAGPPDPAGVAFTGLDERLNLTLSDRWAAHYQGEELGLWVRLVREGGLFDETLLEKEFRLAPATELSVALAREALRRAPRAGEQFYVRWGFRRLGPTSTGVSVDKGSSPLTTYSPGATVRAR